MRTTTLIIASILGAAFAAPVSLSAKSATIKYREDVSKVLQKIICVDHAEPTPQLLWDAGVYDANLEGFVLSGGDWASFAKSRAAGSFHRGFAGGDCGEGRTFAASIPASSPIEIRKNAICLPPDLATQCRGTSVDFAATQGGRSKKLAVTGGCADTKNLPSGLIAVTCLPAFPRWLGPIGIGYVPVSGGPSVTVPNGSVLNSKGIEGVTEESNQLISRRLESWINSLRKSEGLQPISFGDREMLLAGDRLAIGASLTHDRNAIAAEKNALKERGLIFLGEDRVKGNDGERLAWQLFYSARHRDLLLNRAATHGAIVTKLEQGQRFAVIVMAQKNRSSLAKKN